MATFTPKKLAFLQLPSAKGDLLVPGTGKIYEVHNIVLFNSNTTTEVVTLNLHDGTNEYPFFKASLSPLETLDLEFINEGLIVDAVSKITGLTTTATKVTCWVNGTERV